jgi:predicted DNA-binding protein with PD1-like motif
VREKGDEWTDSLRATVRRNPLSAVAVAMAIGALVARSTR